MSPFKINLIGGRRASYYFKPQRRKSLLPLWLLGVFALSFGVGRLSLTETAAQALAGIDTFPIFGQMQLIGSPDRRLEGEADDRINILLLGMGGEGHEGPLLTDTIMVMSFRPSDHQVALLSVPRDLLAPLDGIGWRKINSANAYGELKSPGHGADATRLALEGILGLNIPYYVRIDFEGFARIIDDLGGIDVTVDRAFTDYSYPTTNYGFQTISFKAGLQHLDGDRALKFARSRHAAAGEGSDFARAKRQQKVLAALRVKLLGLRGLGSAGKISDLLASLQANVATNLQIGELLRLAKMARDVGIGDIRHKVLDDGPGSPLVAAVIDGAYVLVPKNDEWGGLRQVAADIFSVAEAETPDESQTAAAAKREKPRVEIQNGSGVTGRARDIAEQLGQNGFQISKIGNAGAFNYKQTLIYDLTDGELPASLLSLKQALAGARVMPPSIKQLTTYGDTIDFLIILGQDGTEEI